MKNLSLICICAACLSACSSPSQFSGMVAGASLGTVIGGSVGGIVGGYRGHQLGTVVGMIAGSAIGSAATAPRGTHNGETDDTPDGYEPRTPQHNTTGETDEWREEEEHRSAAATADDAPLRLRNLRFVDATRNQRLNREETGEIIFELMNTTRRTLHNVVPYISELNGNPHIYLSPSTKIERIRPGEGVRYTVAVKTDKRLKEGTARFRIAVSCDGADFVTLREFELPTEK